MAGAKDVNLKGAQRASMWELHFVLVMVLARDAPNLSVLRVQEGEPTIVFSMVVEKGASWKDGRRVHKVELIFAKHMLDTRTSTSFLSFPCSFLVISSIYFVMSASNSYYHSRSIRQ